MYTVNLSNETELHSSGTFLKSTCKRNITIPQLTYKIYFMLFLKKSAITIPMDQTAL